MDPITMNENAITLMAIAEPIAATLETAPDSWTQYLQTIRNVTASLEFSDTRPDESRRQWQLPLLTVFQRVAYADADAGGIPDIGNWCMKQEATLLQVYPEDVELLIRKPPFSDRSISADIAQSSARTGCFALRNPSRVYMSLNGAPLAAEGVTTCRYLPAKRTDKRKEATQKQKADCTRRTTSKLGGFYYRLLNI